MFDKLTKVVSIEEIKLMPNNNMKHTPKQIIITVKYAQVIWNNCIALALLKATYKWMMH